MDNVAMFMGAGFSTNAGLPTTKTVTDSFLSLNSSSSTPPTTQTAISDILKEFWRDIFGYEDGATTPSFEDHFTLVDLAANTGHNLGQHYTPARLRAIRRLSIHRVFDILNQSYRENRLMSSLLTKMAEGRNNAIISTNWDTVVENHLQHMPDTYSYRLNVRTIPKVSQPKPPTVEKRRGKMMLLKLHGSANLAYCDSCRQIFKISDGKGALQTGVFLEFEDFKRLKKENTTIKEEIDGLGRPSCSLCGALLSARVATFSYSKAFGYFQFQAVWDAALRALRKAKTWVFFGYSLPEADFQIRHLLKTAQIGRRKPANILVALHSDSGRTADNYRRFFGEQIRQSFIVESDGDQLLEAVTTALENLG